MRDRGVVQIVIELPLFGEPNVKSAACTISRCLLLALLMVFLLACTGVSLPVAPAPMASPTSTPPADLRLTPADIVIYPPPVPGLGGPHLYYRGDVLSFDITPRGLGTLRPEDVSVRVYRLDGSRKTVIAEGNLGTPAFDGVPRARLTWVWNTGDARGRETLLIHLDPDDHIQAGDEDPANNVVTLTVRFLAATARPVPEATATWATTTTNCCILHYLTPSAAARDLPTLITTTERAVLFVREKLGIRRADPIHIYFIGRILGHGGYVQQNITVSYLDRSYAIPDVEMTLRHEAVHMLDGSLLGPRTPAILREGFAVWVSGGHYKPEPIPQRAGTLISLGWYIPLPHLAEDFYTHQHEIGYLEAAALVAYLVETYGWENFLNFYRESGLKEGESGANLLDGALRRCFGTGLRETDRAFRRWLAEQPTTSDQIRDLELTRRLFEAVRRYQQIYDPQAYFVSGWLPDPAEGESRGIVTDFLSRARTPGAIALEAMMASAQEMLERGALDQAAVLVDGIERALDGDFSSSPEADYLAIVRKISAQGGEVQRIEFNEAGAWVQFTAGSPELRLQVMPHSNIRPRGQK